MAPSRTIWILGDQLNTGVASLDGADPDTDRILMIRSAGKAASKPFHPLRLRLVGQAMDAFAGQLRDRGFRVDDLTAATFAEGVEAHRRRRRPDVVRAMEPMSWDGLRTMERLGVETVRSNQFLCHYDEFAEWASGRSGRRLVMEDFYRRQRARLGYLMDGDEPEGGRWNWDAENREPPPRDGRDWPRAGRDADWPVTRRQALARLRSFVAEVLPGFGPHQDAMVGGEWRLAHSLLSSSMNIGLLHPREVCDAVEEAYRAGDVPLASAEGFIRQVIGWREYVWGVYWLWMPGFRRRNGLRARRPLPPAFRDGPDATRMACVASALGAVRDHAYAHHIQRLMVLGNLALLAGVRPAEMVDWMWASFIDGAEWVMIPNVIGMALHADGGRMMTKPYAAGGAYIDRMSDHCRGCDYDPRRRTGEGACPFTTLYWDFLARHRDRFAGNGRMRQQIRGLERLRDLDEVRERAREVLARLDRGEL